MKQLSLLLLLLPLCCCAQAWDDANQGWWPAQKSPRQIVTCSIQQPSDVREMNLAQSVSGLAAQALNEGTNEEGVWMETSNPDYQIYYHSLVKRLHAKTSGKYSAWQLVERYKNSGIIKGYVLYDANRADNSINLATVYAALQKGILVDVTQEATAKNKGLVKLHDVTTEVLDEHCFKALQPQLNPHLLVLARPNFSNNRDYAIAHKSMVYYGVDSLLPVILQWVQPLSPIIGWNKGDEFKQIEPCTRWGLINTATDWCMNLALLSIASDEPLPKIRSLDPATINWNKDDNYHAFVMSDGDNMQWTFGSFLSSDDYWHNAYNAAIPMSFTSCLLNLGMAGEDVYTQLVKSQPENVSVVEYGGGYYYPDLFASARPEPEKILRAYAAKINRQMKKTGAKVFGFICRNVSGDAARKAYQIYAEEIEDLTGMIAVQYSPYNGGQGALFWVKNKKGIDIPVVTAKYQLWVNLPKKGSGDPAALAGWINADNAQSSANNKQLNWTIVHAWSRFNGTRGVTPVQWTKEQIAKGTTVVSIEELLWRIRMQYHAADTRNLITKKFPL